MTDAGSTRVLSGSSGVCGSLCLEAGRYCGDVGAVKTCEIHRPVVVPYLQSHVTGCHCCVSRLFVNAVTCKVERLAG